MKTVKIFLASSAELQPDRKEFEIFVSRRSNQWIEERDTKIELVIWENFIDAMSQTRLQDEYNKAIRESDIFVMLFWTKVGKFTEEEFQVAHDAFKANNKPRVYTYFKKDAASNESKDESLITFKKKLSGEFEHYKTVYENTEGLLLHFLIQLEKLYPLTKAEASKISNPNKISRDELIEYIDQFEFMKAVALMNTYFMNKNDKLNALMFEFINQSNNFNRAEYAERLRAFIGVYWK